MTKYSGLALGKLLVEEGLMPPNTRLLDLILSPNEAVIIRYEVFVETADLAKIARVLTRFVEETKT
jgi:hypothetical protein